MSKSPLVRRYILGAMLAAIVLLPIATVWLLWPRLRQQSIQTAFENSAGPSFWWPPSWRQELNILTKLKDPVTLEFVETPLGDVTDFLGDYTGVKFLVDEPDLKQVGITRDTPISVHVEQISLGSALKVMFEPLDVKCRIERGAVRITLRLPGENTMPDLAIAKPGNANEQRIKEKFQESVTLEFVRTPLSDVLDFLRDYTRVNIVAHKPSLAEVEVTSDTPVTIHVEQIPLDLALSILLESIHASYRVEDEVVWITKSTGVPSLDVLIKSGTVYDGSGNRPVHADIGIRGDRIVTIGKFSDAKAEIVIDAKGLAVAPGFINMLSWSNESLIEDGRSQGEVRQGVTTQIMGEGDSMGPLSDAMKRRWKAEQTNIKYDMEWTGLCEYLRWLERRGISQNVASFIGATTIREHVIGLDDRKPTPAELDRMRELVEIEMKDGALGIASSLVYAPAFYATTEELIELCKVAARHRGKYISHIRSEGADLLGAIDELIRISREAKIPAEIYHFKAAGQPNWDKMDAAIERVETARREGLAITADMYCYPAGSTGLNASIPPWVHDGGQEKLRERVRDPATRARIIDEIKHKTDGWENFYLGAGSPDRILLNEFAKEHLKPLQGKTLAEVAAQRGKDPVETLLDLVVEDESRIGTVYFMMSEENVRKLITLPWVSFGSDAASQSPEGVFLKSSTHPRAYGNFAQLLGKYVRDEKLLRLEQAIQRLSHAPAANLGLAGRGMLRAGYFADVVVFDPATIADRATFERPHQFAVGVQHVFVNGVQVLKDGEHTGAKPGRALWGPGKAAN